MGQIREPLTPIAARPLATLLPTTAFALSGGGAKGSFEVGALKHLMQRLGIKPDLLVCTSVGSVNGIKLAEGEGPAVTINGQQHVRGLVGLEQTWKSLMQASDMFVPGPALQALPIDYQTSLSAVLTQAEGVAEGAVTSTAGAGLALLGFLGPAGLGFLGNNPASDLLNQLNAVVDADSLFTLDPVANRYDSGEVAPNLVVGSGIAVIFATVGLGSGKLAYVRLAGLNAQGRLVGDLVVGADIGTPIPASSALSPAIDMKIAMLASAASPLYFAPQQLPASGSLGADKYTDGGVREVVPVRGALGRGAKRVFAVDCNAPFYGGSGTSGLLNIGPQVLAILLDAVDDYDTDPPSTSEGYLWHIRPLYEVHGDLEINPGPIRVAIDYGQMCAFDCADSSVRSTARRTILQQLGQEVAMGRRGVADAERCLQWVVRAWTQRLALLPQQANPQGLVSTLGYEPSGASTTGRYANLTADLDLGAGFLPGAPFSGHYIDLLLSSSPPPAVAVADALGILQDLKCRFKPYFEARVTMAGAGSVPPDPDDANATDSPWARYETQGISGADGSQPPESFFGTLWPSGVTCPSELSLSTTTQLSVFSHQVELNGTSGWAVPTVTGYPASINVLVPNGDTFTHVSGEFGVRNTTTVVSPWAAPPGSQWAAAWQNTATVPATLGAAVKWVTCCPLPDASPYPGLHAVARLATSGGDTLLELSYNGQTSAWAVIGQIATCSGPVTGITGNPVLLQAEFAQEESFELLVPAGSQVIHLCRHAGDSEWSPRAGGVAYDAASSSSSSSSPSSSGSGVGSAPLVEAPYSITCFQGNYDAPGNLEAVVGVGPITSNAPETLVALYFDSWNQKWQTIAPITPSDGPIPAPTGDPYMFQSRIGTQGDFELLMPCGGQVIHLCRQNDAGMDWKRRGSGVAYTATTGGTGIHSQALTAPTPIAISAYQSIDGVAGSPNIEAVLRLRPITINQPDAYAALWFDPSTSTWENAGTVEVGTTAVTTPTS